MEKAKDVKSDTIVENKKEEFIPHGKVKMINSGIIRLVPINRVSDFKKMGYVEM